MSTDFEAHPCSLFWQYLYINCRIRKFSRLPEKSALLSADPFLIPVFCKFFLFSRFVLSFHQTRDFSRQSPGNGHHPNLHMNFRTLNNLTGWLTFAIAAVVLAAAAEPTGSLWDCGEFISGAYKLQVVHPPGAPVFLIVGRMFTWVADLLSDNPSNIAYAVNLLSALCTAFTAMFVCWSTTILARLIVGSREQTEFSAGESVAIAAAGLTAGLVTAFTTSIWFSAVEGEVYAMSTFFTAMTLWATLKWYYLPDEPESDRWLVFAFYSTALSIGVHLLSLLTFPALAILYYNKKRPNPSWRGMVISALIGVAFILAIQTLIIVGIPRLWAFFDKFLVNSFGMPFYTGIIPVALLFGVAFWYALRWTERKQNGLIQRVVVALGVTVIAYTSYGMVIVRASANPPINMNDPSDPMRLLPYLNREQYGERPLVRGPHFDAKPVDLTSEDRYGRVGDRYRIVDEKYDYVYASGDKSLFPRMGDNTQGRPRLYRQWIDKKSGEPTFMDNIEFFWKYQLGWMYFRYFMWNFTGRQNGEQGLYAWDPSAGHWISGVKVIDEARLGSQENQPAVLGDNQAHNTYYFIPFLLGIIGAVFHYKRRRNDFIAILALFIITGIGIIVYSNQPPNEPRERDYVLAASFFTYAIWIGLSVLAIFDILARRINNALAPAAIAGVIGLVAPLLMVTQNWDDHSRSKHYASRDYARNFLESCKPNAIIFTYGDNDTYPLWYCQEVENIRTDVRVVNLSLIAVDWYINQMRRAVNNSPAIKMSIPAEEIRGFKRVQIPYYSPNGEREMSIYDLVKYLGESHPVPSQGGRDFDTHLPTRKFFIPVDKEKALANGIISPGDSNLVDTIHVNLGEKTDYIIKDQLAMLDIIASNIWERPIYWAVTCREDRLLEMQDFLSLEGLALRIVPTKTPSVSMEQFGIVGAGRVDTEVAYKNIMEKWQWGNFDKEKLYVDRSYMPSLQTMRLVFYRLGRDLILENKKDKAIALMDQYFKSFPEFNFPPDLFSAYMANIYHLAGDEGKAAAKARDIARTLEYNLQYYFAQSAEMREAYRQDIQYNLNAVQILMRIAEDSKNQELAEELNKTFAAFMPKQEGPRLPGIQ